MLNPTKSTSTLFTPDPAEYSTELQLTIDNQQIPTVSNPKILGITFDPKLNYSSHIQNIISKANKTLNILKALTSSKWGKQKETLKATYMTIIRPIIEYACTVWEPIISDTNLNKLQIIQNTALRIITGCTQDTNIQHLHNETKILPLKDHIRLHSSILRQKALLPSHPLHTITQTPATPRLMKQTTFYNTNFTYNIDTPPDQTSTETIKRNCKSIHSSIVQRYLTNKPKNSFIQDNPPDIHHSEMTLDRQTRRRLAQLRTDKSPFLESYLHHIDPTNHPSPECPLCSSDIHDTYHLFVCPYLLSTLCVVDLWLNPVQVAELLERWKTALDRRD